MIYHFNQTNYHTFSVIQDNVLPSRSYFIPYSSTDKLEGIELCEKRYRSDKVEVLNGEWDFRFYHDPKEVPEAFDTDGITFDKVPVPSCWQFTGYMDPFYLNLRYQFPFNPPVIPTTEKVGRIYSMIGYDIGVKPTFITPKDSYNSVGVYRREIEVADLSKIYILSFLGVASCIDVYVNGAYVGYSEGSHNTCEFNITPRLREGANELVCVVHRWCNGTYLECQDMFRNNGIFRDVLLYICDDTDVFDFAFETKYENGKYTAAVRVKGFASTVCHVSLRGKNISKGVRLPIKKDGFTKAIFKELEPEEWNAENPALYELTLETETSAIRTKVGFKHVEIEGNVYKLNGSRVKFKGVNHHDTNPRTGYVMTPADILKDLEVCKAFNIDTIRTSHYPPDPLLLELADEMGIYIVDETNIETHGAQAMAFPPTISYISRDIKWAPHYVRRAEQMFERDKNHPSIVLWSLGNESGGDACQDVMYSYFKKHSDIPVHYESAVHAKRIAYDVASEMYPEASSLHKIGEGTHHQKKFLDRPYFMCEYSHAMGLGPGDVESYWKEIYAYDNLMGGCVWEMNDHAVLEADGHYTYGGDHGEYMHDGNFCVDGLFFPDRTPSSGAKHLRFVYRPIRIRHLDGDRFEIFNTTAFSNGRRYRLIFRANGSEFHEGSFDVAPLSREIVEVALPTIPETEDLFVNVEVIDTVTGNSVSEEQIVLRESFREVRSLRPTALPETFRVEPDGKVVFGDLVSADESTLLFRAATDNDRPMMGAIPGKLNVAKFYTASEKLVDIECTDTSVIVRKQIRGKGFGFEEITEYSGTEEGVLVRSTLHPTRKSGSWMPRFAKVFRLGEAFDTVSYFGRREESYIDMKDHAPIEKVSCKVCDMVTDYIRPQESGNRADTKWVTVSDGSESYTFEAVEKAFELGIKPYTDRALIQWKHTPDVKKEATYIALSAFQAGIGTGSCGPVSSACNQFPMDRDYTVSFLLSKQ